MAEPGKKFPWEEKLVRSGFLVGAVLVHLVIFTLIAGYVIFQPPAPPPPDSTVTHQFVVAPAEVPPMPPNDAASSSVVPVAAISGADTDVSVNPVHPQVKRGLDVGIGLIGPDSIHGQDLIHPALKIRTHDLSPERRKQIEDFELAHRTLDNILRHDPAGDYPVYVASYADGDWSCNLDLDAGGNIVAGSIPNLAAKIGEWTHGQVRARVVARPLNLAGPDLLEQKPPFIFFTGHKDFVLTAREVENLQAYVEMGGAIWGDNAEAGLGSRFDVAFRREMKRVIPGENFQPLATDAEIFKGRFHFDQTPQGMNYLADPIEHLDLEGKVAILYTPNDYSDLYTMRILPGDEQIQGTFPAPDSPLVTPGLFLYNRGIYFRNYTLPSSLAVQRLGLNIVTYLVTRFDDELQLPP